MIHGRSAPEHRRSSTVVSVDPLSSLLSGIRAEGSVVTRAVLTRPWTIRFADAAPLTMICVLRGGGTLLLPDGTERAVGAGDTALVRGPEPFHLVDHPATCTALTPPTRSPASRRAPHAPPRNWAVSTGAPTRRTRPR
ncbi:cupin domain-containing protein [Streptomyces sp. NPDC085931]|uniref:cupin domain-containing protein n=1 Tax=Streptomyces sp. NPDC085931 TaxID=3365740 RepID=UPI0037D3A4E1